MGRPDNENGEVLLRVENLCQYFKSGSYENKAVDNVSFDIKKGEVFGLVGESGCGKTTTGRSIIKIYDITSGSIYFKGQRICAGTRSYRDAIKAAKKELSELKGGNEARRKELEAEIEKNKEEIKKAKFDHKNSDKLYAAEQVKKVKAEYEPKLEKATGEEKAKLQKEYKDAIEYYTRAIAQDRDFAEAYFNRGLTYVYIGENEKGLADLSKAGELGIYQAYNLITRFK